VMHLDASSDGGAPIMAGMTAVSVISAR
jgi:hypothetical protein